MKKSEWITLILVFALDIATKYAMQSFLVLGDPLAMIPNFFYLTLSYNSGAAWGMLSGQLELFYVITLAVVGVVTYMLFTSMEKSKLFRYGLVLILAGTLGNFFDRVIFGYVRDFLDFYIFGYDFPIFNLADSALTIGFALLAFHLIRHPEDF